MLFANTPTNKNYNRFQLTFALPEETFIQKKDFLGNFCEIYNLGQKHL